MNLRTFASSESIDLPQVRLPFTERGALRLFVGRESFFRNLRDSILAIVSASPAPSSARGQYVLRRITVTRADYSGRSAVLSLLLHCTIAALLLYLPAHLPGEAPPLPDTSQRLEVIYYRVPLRKITKATSASSTARLRNSTAHSVIARTLKSQSTPEHSIAAIISAPAKPDNFRQTIYQSIAPPDLRIKTKQKLPNMEILEHNQAALKVPLVPSYVRPTWIERQVMKGQAPAVSATNLPNLTRHLLALSGSNPHLIIPFAGGGAPMIRAVNVAEVPAAASPDLVIVGLDSSDAAKQVSVLNGNRWGEFTVSPPTQPSGPPTAADTRSVKKEGSFGKGHGISATAGAIGPVGSAGSGNSQSGLLNATLAVALVYPVTQPITSVRRNPMVISTGPIGGGGINVYGALNCGKIYSIFLPMPGRNWSLQYCDKSSAATDRTAEARESVVHLGRPLVPPDVELNHRYTFKRIAVPAAKANRQIVLKGVIGTDGTVHKLTVYRGVSPELDEAARIAFRRWRFKPAMRDGKPVAVDILVGIPPATGGKRLDR